MSFTDSERKRDEGYLITLTHLGSRGINNINKIIIFIMDCTKHMLRRGDHYISFLKFQKFVGVMKANSEKKTSPLDLETIKK